MNKQRTLDSKFYLKSVGLYTGKEVTVTFSPAPVNYGYKIHRTDLPGQPAIPVNAMYVSFADKRNVLAINDIVQVSMTEHGLAALYACEIDNCRIDVDAPEFPFLDGSSVEFVNKIREVGIRELAEKRIYYVPDHIIEYMDEQSGSHLILLPSDSFGVHLQISYDSSVLSVQSASLNNLSCFADEIAMCRPFVFIREMKSLMGKKLMERGYLDNTIVVYDRKINQKLFDMLTDRMNLARNDAQKLGYIMNTPFYYLNEPARHALLDLMGSLALIGKFIKGLIIAVCPTHTVNNAFARTILNNIEDNAFHQFKSESITI
jgi:UDP-3-O-[3-hydroxymyristoyl] N-acetylglucosamine deacetylase/3-hydroxyacyl-[acyl-carrier-protein] dehydratase